VEKYDIVVSLKGENGTNGKTCCKKFDLSGTTLNTTLKYKDKIISHFCLSEYRENTIQYTAANLIKRHF